jgi:carbon-monoxide dehydrogenase medium subunit
MRGSSLVRHGKNSIRRRPKNKETKVLSRLKAFKYLEPSNLSEAVSLLDQFEGRAKILAGGTDLIIQMKQRKLTPEYVINLKNIPELNYIKYDGKDLRIGPLVTHSSVANSPIIKENFGLLLEAVLAVGVVQTRNRGTVAGNLCNASPSADTPPALIALGAKLKVLSSEGERIINVENFFKGPFATVLKKKEILAEIQIPHLPPYSGGAYLWLPKITAVDETLVGVGVLIAVDSERVCTQARIGLGSIAPTPIRAFKTEEFLRGKRIENGLFEKAGEIAADESSPRSREEYRREMVKVFVKRALGEAFRKIK